MLEYLTYYTMLIPFLIFTLTTSLYLLSTLPFLPAPLPQYLSFLARTIASFSVLLLCATYGVLASLYLRLTTGTPQIAQWATARAFALTMPLFTGVHFDIVSGAEHLSTRPMVLVGNHQSALDVLLLAAIFPKYCSVTAKASLRNVPVLGWFMALSGTVFIDRGDRKSALMAFEAAAEEMTGGRDRNNRNRGGGGQSVFIFPEGTRHSGPELVLGAFKKGAFHLAVKAQVPVVVCVAANYWGVCAFGHGRFKSGRVPIRVLPPIPTKGLTSADVDDLTTKVRDMMLAELVALSKTPAGRRAISVDERNTAPEQKRGGGAMEDGNGRMAVAASGVER